MKHIIKKVINYAFVLMFVILAVLPVWITVVSSFMNPAEIQNCYTQEVTDENKGDAQKDGLHFVKISLWPKEWSLIQYQNLLHGNIRYWKMMKNSILLVVPILLGQLVIAPLAAYGFEQIKWRFKEAVFFVYIIVMLMPMQLLLVPHFLVAGWLGIRDSYLAIILPAVFHPLGVFLVRQQIKGFPKECLEAARLDGAGEWRIFRKIVRPNMAGILAAMLVLLFTDNWNIVDQAVVFIREAAREPMSVYLNQIWENDPGMFFAVSVIYAIPAICVFSIGKKHLLEGISMSAVKG